MADKLLEYRMNFEYLATPEKTSRLLQKVYGDGTMNLCGMKSVEMKDVTDDENQGHLTTPRSS
jgi:hypothetical protein